MRRITRRTLLYTEMVTTGALIHGERARFLFFDPDEHPLALQLGGSDPHDMAYCARLAEDTGFDEVNINVGCPSERVQNGAFGACLMGAPERVADCVAAMKARVTIAVTVKTRIGIDDFDDYAFLLDFAQAMRDAGADGLIVHARKAWLTGLSPKQNREIPPLDYARVHRLAQDLADVPVCINGGIADLDTAAAQLDSVDGVMIGRAAYRDPFLMAGVDRRFFGADTPLPTRGAIVAGMREYIGRHLANGGALKDVTRHMLGLYHGQPGGRAWRRVLAEDGHRAGADLAVLDRALARVTPDTEEALA